MTTDSYTLTLTCQSGSRAICGDEVYSYTSTPSSTTDGLYDIEVSPPLAGIYDISIIMENAATQADQNIDITVCGISLTLEVIGDITVPSFCDVLIAPSTGDIVRPDGEAFSFTIQSKSADGRP